MTRMMTCCNRRFGSGLQPTQVGLCSGDGVRSCYWIISLIPIARKTNIMHTKDLSYMTVYVFIFVDTSFIHGLAAPLKETNMFRDPICSSECQKKCSISDRQSANIPPDSSNSAVESAIKFVKSALQTK